VEKKRIRFDYSNEYKGVKGEAKYKHVVLGAATLRMSNWATTIAIFFNRRGTRYDGRSFFLILTLSAGWRECGLQNCSSNKRPTILGKMCLSGAIPYRPFTQGHTTFEWLSHFLIFASISGPPRREAGNGNRIEKSLPTTKHSIGVSVCSISSTLLRWEHTLLEQVSTVCCHCQEYSSHYSKRHAGPPIGISSFCFVSISVSGGCGCLGSCATWFERESSIQSGRK
jgi:hypothetical protein